MMAIVVILFLVALLEPSFQLPAPEPATSETLPGAFWHFSDLHIEFLYTVGSNASNLCQGPASGDVQDAEDGSGVGAAGAYGCDSPPVLALSSLEAMSRLQPNVSLILWTGDSGPHRRGSNPGQEYIAQATSLVFSRLSQLFPRVPVVAALGNHDISPPNQWPVGGPVYASLWGQGGYSSHIPSGQQDSFLHCGFYSTTAAGLNFLVLNTNIYRKDKQVEGEDPCGQLSWLEAQLVEAEERESKVYIVGHIPPSSWSTPRDTVEEIRARFLGLLIRFSNVVVAQMYGHKHTDAFRLLRSEEGESVGFGLTQGSVSPLIGSNPSVRLYSYKNHGGLEDYAQYFLDLEEVQAVRNISAAELGTRWKLLYRASESYGLKDLSPSSFEAFWEKLRTNEDGLFNQYQSNSKAGRGGGKCECYRCVSEEDCWRKTLCNAGFTNSTQMSSCLATLKPGSESGLKEIVPLH
jgi:hypothetical protein